MLPNTEEVASTSEIKAIALAIFAINVEAELKEPLKDIALAIVAEAEVSAPNDPSRAKLPLIVATKEELAVIVESGAIANAPLIVAEAVVEYAMSPANTKLPIIVAEAKLAAEAELATAIDILAIPSASVEAETLELKGLTIVI
jgi:hypothetical protein